MTHIEKMKQWLGALEVEDMACRYEKEATPEYIAKVITDLRQAIKDAEGQEKALQSLHAENERLGLYKDAYAEQEPVAWRETRSKVIKALAGIVNVHTPDKLFDLDAIPREPVMGLVQQIKVAIDAYQPRHTEQEPRDCILTEIEYAHHHGWPLESQKRLVRMVEAQRQTPPAQPPQRTEQEPFIDKSAAIRIATALGWEPKREWVGLTDEEKSEIWADCWEDENRSLGIVEAKLKQKNGYAEENT